MKKTFLLLALALPTAALPAPAPAQAPAPKVLLVVRDFVRDQGSEEAKFDFALYRAVKMKEAGIDVAVSFEDKAVLCFLDLHGELDKPAMKKKVKDLEDALAAEPEEKRAKKEVRPPKYWLAGRQIGLPPSRREIIQRFLDLKIPYTVSAQSARDYDVFDELKAAGEPLTAGKGRAEDLSPYIKQGYQVIIH